MGSRVLFRIFVCAPLPPYNSYERVHLFDGTPSLLLCSLSIQLSYAPKDGLWTSPWL